MYSILCNPSLFSCPLQESTLKITHPASYLTSPASAAPTPPFKTVRFLLQCFWLVSTVLLSILHPFTVECVPLGSCSSTAPQAVVVTLSDLLLQTHFVLEQLLCWILFLMQPYRFTSTKWAQTLSAGLDFWRRIYRQTSPWTHYSNTWIQVVTPIKLFLIYSLRTLSVNSSLVLWQQNSLVSGLKLEYIYLFFTIFLALFFLLLLGLTATYTPEQHICFFSSSFFGCCDLYSRATYSPENSPVILWCWKLDDGLARRNNTAHKFDLPVPSSLLEPCGHLMRSWERNKCAVDWFT